MSDKSETAVSLPSGKKGSQYHEVKWEVVAQMPGLTPATIVAGRLKAEGVPVRVWQEGAGQALGLTVGLLGTGYVAVPEEYKDQALTILETDYEDDAADWDDEESVN
ncbi:MAG: hypothetical protein H6656_11290 [Ardenticatenaceae bacterium]|nr:hypothetical protein [Ardenticatenaceae bacterium]